MHACLADDEFLDAQAPCGASQRYDADEFGGHLGNLAETVHHPLLEGFDLVVGLHIVEFTVQGDAFVLLRHITGGEHQFQVGVHHAVGDKLGATFQRITVICGACSECVGKFFGTQFGDGLLEHALVGLIAQVGDEAALLGSQQVARTADVQVLHGNLDAGAQVAETLDGLQAAARIGCQRLARRHEQVAEGLAAAAPHAASQLVQVA